MVTFSSIQKALLALQVEILDNDFDKWSGEAATKILEKAVPVQNSLSAFVRAAAAHAVHTNQHCQEGAASDPAGFLGPKTGASRKRTQARMSSQRRLDGLPDVKAAFEQGRLSEDEVDSIVNQSRDDVARAHRLMQAALK